ncbi:ABC-type dipeptide transport system2C periplasmic component [gamma proteobacterium IMCC2047]|nr:ABC-type dipeptide transport system2C periplasmic component [gamma proteobacterium IMCC2047]
MKMFSKITKVLSAGVLAVAASSAFAINIGGVVWDPASPADFQSNGNVYETFATQVGDTVTGFGVITQFNGTTQPTFCPGCELTFTFSLRLASAQLVYNGPQGPVSAFTFDQVAVKMYVDNSQDYDQVAPSLASASNGVLFLDAVNNGLLSGSATNLFDPNLINGSGTGFLDVIGGIAAANFDTNTKDNGSDIQYTSSFQSAQLNVPGYPLFGSVDLSGDTIPSPAPLALIGLGLLGMGIARRRKS